MEDEQAAAKAATMPYWKQVNETPALLSILYDIDLLPEQVTTIVNARRMIVVCACFKVMTPDQISNLFASASQEEQR